MRRTLGSRKGIGAGAMIALCLAAASAVAQDRPVTTRQDRADTVKVNVSGRIDMDYVHRDAALMSVGGMQHVANVDGNSVNTVEGEVAVRFDAELTEKVSAVIEFMRKREDGGVDPFDGNFTGDLTVREAYLKVMDFLQQGLSVKLGILDWSFDVRGRGSAFAFDPFNSQLISRNHILGQDTTAAMAGRYGIDNMEILEPVGGHLSYTSGAVTVDLVLLPVIEEEGLVAEDEALYAANLWYRMDEMGKGSRIGAIIALHNLSDNSPIADTGSGTRMITFGAGANLVFGQLEVYGEGYLQRGGAGRNAVGDEFDANGHAFQIGGRYNAAGENNLWLELNFTLISGDDDTGVDEEVDSFLSYENVNDFLIIEDQWFGLDIDTNLTAIKIMGGGSFSVAGGKNNVELMVGVGFFTTTKDVIDTTTGDEEDALGTEIDVKARYHLNKQAALALNFGILTGSDILEAMGGGSGVDAADDSAWLASLGFDVRM